MYLIYYINAVFSDLRRDPDLSVRLLISSTLLFEAASSSCMLKDLSVLKEMHDSHLSHASPFSFRLLQFIVLAKILAHVVLPTPLGRKKDTTE